MKNVWYFIIANFVCNLVFSYNNLNGQSPGGVTHPKIWKKFEGSSDYSIYGNGLFNYNSYKYFDNQKDKLELAHVPLKKISMFIVFSSLSEGKILNIENDGTEVLLLKDNAVLSNKTVEYGETFEKPKILSFHDVLSNEKKWFGSKLLVEANGRNNSDYIGGISEVILFDKILKKNDREKVDSYLSIKYGIPLQDTSVYYSSTGSILWNGRLKYPYQHHVTAIYRDDKSALYQKQSKNIYSDISLTLGLDKIHDHNDNNMSYFGNYESIFWADDNNNIDFNILDEGVFQLNRKWIIQNNISTTDFQNVHLMVDFGKSKNFDEKLNTYLIFGSGDKLLIKSETKWIKMSRVNNTLYECYLDLADMKNTSNYFTFQQRKSQDVMVQTGTIDCEMKVGEIILSTKSTDTSNLKYDVLNSDGQIIHSGVFKSNRHMVSNLQFGMYNIHIYEEGFLTNTYVLKIDDQKCEGNTSIYPNPVYVGTDFSVQSNEFLSEQVEYEVINSGGQVVVKNIVDVSDELLIIQSLNTTGIYQVRLKSKTKERTLDIIVIQ